MLIGVNTLGLKPGCGGGAERYLRNVLATIRQIQPDTRILILTDPGNHDSFQGWDRECVEGGMLRGFLSGGDATLVRALAKRGADVLFSPLETVPAKCPVPYVVYALDLYRWEPEILKHNRDDAKRLKALKQTCAGAAALVAPSEFVRRKCLELLDLPLNKVVVAPLGVSAEFSKPQASMVDEPYFLFVGATRACKNLGRLCEAIAHLRKDLPHTLVVAGSPGEAEPESWPVPIVRVEQCPVNCIAGLYQHCNLYIQPSLYEGSGVTVVEAMRSGAVVATSRTGGIEEVAGDTPIFFNPESVSSITSAIRRAFDEPVEQRRNRIHFGRQAAAEYTWERCAWKTLSAFKHT